jgi:hypothetical protein
VDSIWSINEESVESTRSLPGVLKEFTRTLSSSFSSIAYCPVLLSFDHPLYVKEGMQKSIEVVRCHSI